jgi:hypothetical protein
MKVFVFDLLAYDANLDHLKNGGLRGQLHGSAALLQMTDFG